VVRGAGLEVRAGDGHLVARRRAAEAFALHRVSYWWAYARIRVFFIYVFHSKDIINPRRGCSRINSNLSKIPIE
jgi:hypothetical protein